MGWSPPLGWSGVDCGEPVEQEAKDRTRMRGREGLGGEGIVGLRWEARILSSIGRLHILPRLLVGI